MVTESLREVFVTVGAFSLAQVRRQKLRSGSGIKGVTVPLGDDRRAVDPIAPIEVKASLARLPRSTSYWSRSRTNCASSGR
jgi:hypothetical protein